LELVASHPELGERRREIGQDIRCLSMGSYFLVYRVATGTIELLRVLHAARDIDAIF
jgi:toxin ParE1/3/4